MSEDEDSSLSSLDQPRSPKICSTTVKHIYFDDEHDDDENPALQKLIERPAPSTIRVDGSDLISRCKDFLPLLSDTKDQSNENLSSKKDDDDDEFNIPEILSEKSSKESGEASSTAEEDKSKEIIKKKRKKKKKKKKKKLKTDENLNQDLPLQQ
jgi:hypothetical protein